MEFGPEKPGQTFKTRKLLTDPLWKNLIEFLELIKEIFPGHIMISLVLIPRLQFINSMKIRMPDSSSKSAGRSIWKGLQPLMMK